MCVTVPAAAPGVAIVRREDFMLGVSRKRAPWIAAVTFALASSGAVFAQPSRPSSPPDKLLDNDRGTQQHDTHDRGAGDVPMVPPMYGGGGYSGDYPTGSVNMAVDANARAAFQRAQYHRLQFAMDNSIRQMQYEFEHSRDMVDAQRAEKQAWDDYVSARNAALKSVVNDPKYQANLQLKNELGDRIAGTRATWDASRPAVKAAQCDYDKQEMKAVLNLATVKLDYAQVVTDMEVAALRNDSKVADARNKLMAAGARVQAQRDGFDASIRSSRELANLRNQIEDARVASITAEAYRNGAVEAANTALDYAYWKNRYNYPNYSTDWPYGYGYGTRVLVRN
jgi:hypothetical protein